MQQVRVGSVWVELSEKFTGKCEQTGVSKDCAGRILESFVGFRCKRKLVLLA
jgi:hypothetical protein